jgi:hypothetical protein
MMIRELATIERWRVLIRLTVLTLMCSVLFSVSLRAQTFSPAIEDNSFLIEEAYNQETRVVQHISNVYVATRTHNVLLTFTEEWPMGSQAHQFSYTVPYQALRTGKGLGDVLLNYRYQLLGENDPVWCAPRMSMSIPTGSPSKGLGTGVFGVQMSVPVSRRWSNEFVSHFNLGLTSFLQAEGTDAQGYAEKRNLTSFTMGASGIYLLAENFNLMFELLHNENAGFDLSGNVVYSSQTIISPGFRFAINLPNLQIVPGLAVPISITAASTEVGVFGYLSFEHPF